MRQSVTRLPHHQIPIALPIISAKENVKTVKAGAITRLRDNRVIRPNRQMLILTVLISGTAVITRRPAHQEVATREAAIVLISGTGMYLKIAGRKKNLQKKIYKTR